MPNENTNWRSRRLNACRAAGDLRSVIENLNYDDGSMSEGDTRDNTTSKAMKQNLQNQVDNLLHQILLFNDGNVV